MVFAQIVVNIKSRRLYNVGIFGRKKVRICGITYNDDDEKGNHTPSKLIVIKSDTLSLQYGTDRHFVFPSKQSNHYSFNSDIEFICDFNGQLDIEIIDKATNTNPTTFTSLILYLDISDISDVSKNIL